MGRGDGAVAEAHTATLTRGATMVEWESPEQAATQLLGELRSGSDQLAQAGEREYSDLLDIAYKRFLFHTQGKDPSDWAGTMRELENLKPNLYRASRAAAKLNLNRAAQALHAGSELIQAGEDAPQPPEKLSDLTPRQAELLKMVAGGTQGVYWSSADETRVLRALRAQGLVENAKGSPVYWELTQAGIALLPEGSYEAPDYSISE